MVSGSFFIQDYYTLSGQNKWPKTASARVKGNLSYHWKLVAQKCL